ncbi:MAG TPA: hypothetical protein VGM10_23205 [Actinocrinis sp.]
MSIPQTPGSPYGYPPPGPPQPPAVPGDLTATKPTALQRTLGIVMLIAFVGGLYGLIITGRSLEVLAVLGAIYVGALLTGALNYASARIFGRRIVAVRWAGFGRQVRYRVNGKQLICWNAVPFFISVRVVETERSLGRGRQGTRLAMVLVWIALAAAGLLLAFDPGSVYFAAMVLFVLGLAAWSPDLATGLRGPARLLARLDRRNAPALADPLRVAALNAAIDAQFGDFESAQAALARLDAEPEGAEAAALLRIDIASAACDFEAALVLPWPPAAPGAPAHVAKLRAAMIATRRARLILLAAQRRPETMPYAFAEASALFTSVPRTETVAHGGAEVRTLLSLATGNPKRARGANTAARGSANTPVAVADALCDRALIEAATGDVRGRGRKALVHAAQVAPWYQRLATVHGMISQGMINTAPMPMQGVPMGAPVYPPPAQQEPPMPTDPWAAPPA